MTSIHLSSIYVIILIIRLLVFITSIMVIMILAMVGVSRAGAVTSVRDMSPSPIPSILLIIRNMINFDVRVVLL